MIGEDDDGQKDGNDGGDSDGIYDGVNAVAEVACVGAGEGLPLLLD